MAARSDWPLALVVIAIVLGPSGCTAVGLWGKYRAAEAIVAGRCAAEAR